MNREVIGYASTKKGLILLFCEKCYVPNWKIKKDENGKLRFYNKVLGQFLSDLVVIKEGGKFVATRG